MQVSKEDLYTPSEICAMYPQINLTPQMITMLLRNNFLEGVVKKREIFIKLSSWRKLMEFRNSILEQQKV